MATYQFGVASTLTTAYGLIQNFTVTNSGETSEAKDQNGETVHVTNHGEVLEATAELIHDTAQKAPGFGDVITTTGVHAGKYQVMSVTETESNSDHKKLSVTLKKWVKNSLPA